jgi:hypothetical protein
MSDGNHGGQFNRRGVVSNLSGNLQTGLSWCIERRRFQFDQAL